MLLLGIVAYDILPKALNQKHLRKTRRSLVSRIVD
jgi:hypothetical protein